MSNIVLLGAGGRMGGALVRCLQQGTVEGLHLHGATDLWDHPGLGKDIGLSAGAGETGVLLSSNLAEAAEGADVVIDFSGHQSTSGNAPRIADMGLAWIIGTTGLSDEEKVPIQDAAQRVPVVMAPNMSLGVNLLLSLVEQAATSLRGKGYDIEIIERHHNQKKDAPSGTALGLGEAAAAGYQVNLGDTAVHGREGLVGERTPEEIGFHAVRGGDFVGDHTVLFATQGESVELSHRATSRDTFAMGALRAAAWAVGREPGLYSMHDVLGL